MMKEFRMFAIIQTLKRIHDGNDRTTIWPFFRWNRIFDEEIS